MFFKNLFSSIPVITPADVVNKSVLLGSNLPDYGKELFVTTTSRNSLRSERSAGSRGFLYSIVSHTLSLPHKRTRHLLVHVSPQSLAETIKNQNYFMWIGMRGSFRCSGRSPHQYSFPCQTPPTAGVASPAQISRGFSGSWVKDSGMGSSFTIMDIPLKVSK